MILKGRRAAGKQQARFQLLDKAFKSWGEGWQPSTIDRVLTSHPAAPGSSLGLGIEIYQQHSCLEIECGQRRLNNVKRTHLVRASGKLVLQKAIES